MKPSIPKSITPIIILARDGRFKMKAFRLVIAGTLLAGVSAYAQPAPDWSACIGTGRAVSGCESAATSSTSLARATNHASSMPWSAFIGTGRVSGDSDRRQKAPAVSSDAALQLAAHWSARIGSGHVLDGATYRQSRAAALPAGFPTSAVALKQQLGQRP